MTANKESSGHTRRQAGSRVGGGGRASPRRTTFRPASRGAAPAGRGARLRQCV